METYKVYFNPDKTKGVYGISLVADPAIEELLVQMNKEYIVELAEVDEEKRLFMSPVLIPNQKILRLDKDNNPFNLVFEADVIRLAQQNFQKRGFQNNSTLEHDINLKLEGVSFVESWIKEDDVHDKSLMKGYNLPIGTWFTIFRVDDDEVLAKIKSGEIKGVSIDGAFEIDGNVNLKRMDINTILQAIKDGFSSLNAPKEVKLASAKTIDDMTVYFEGELMADTLVFADEAMTEPLADGNYEFEAFTLVVAGGKVAEMNEKEAAAEEEVAMASDPLAEIKKILDVYTAEMSKEVANQLATFKTELKAEQTQEEEVRLAKAEPKHEVKEPTTLVEKFMNELKKNN